MAQPPQILLQNAVALHQGGRMAEAEQAYRALLAVSPNHPDGLHLLGLLAHQCGHSAAGADLIRQAIAVSPGNPTFYSNLGAVLVTSGRGEEALAPLRQAIALNPGYRDARNNLASLLSRREEFAEAAEQYGASLEADPNQPRTLGHYALMLASLCAWEHLDQVRPRLIQAIQAGQPLPPFNLLALDIPPALRRACSDANAHSVAATVAPWRTALGPPPPPQPAERLVIGYLSNDFRQHATTWLMAELFELHDRAKVTVKVFSYAPGDGSPARARIEAAADGGVIDLTALPPLEAARRIRAEGVQILIDLKGYTADARPEIMALRPAPVQVAYLGFPGTMGGDFIDYVLADAVVAPFADQPWFAERIVHLPHCYQINDRKRPRPAPVADRTRLGLPAEGLVLCCFNNSYKITRPVFDAWMRILAAVPDAVLWLLGTSAQAEQRLRSEAALRGVDPARLIFAPRCPPDQHLARHGAADLFLDTSPCGAHTTASDALWAGLPLVTLTGDSFASRVAASLLAAVGLPELATRTLEDYEQLIGALAADRPLLAALRTHLENARDSAPLFDSPALTRAIEAACRVMWDRACQGLPPQAFALNPFPEATATEEARS